MRLVVGEFHQQFREISQRVRIETRRGQPEDDDPFDHLRSNFGYCLRRARPEIADRGTVRLGSGVITADFPLYS